jgi:hypothetical protein
MVRAMRIYDAIVNGHRLPRTRRRRSAKERRFGVFTQMRGSSAPLTTDLSQAHIGPTEPNMTENPPIRK